MCRLFYDSEIKRKQAVPVNVIKLKMTLQSERSEKKENQEG